MSICIHAESDPEYRGKKHCTPRIILNEAVKKCGIGSKTEGVLVESVGDDTIILSIKMGEANNKTSETTGPKRDEHC